jgi:hypothetical protein
MFIVSAASVAQYSVIRFQMGAWSGSVYRSTQQLLAVRDRLGDQV